MVTAPLNVFLDLETVDSQDEAIRQRVVDTVRPPRSIKKAETLAKWEAEERPVATQAAVDAMALHGEHANIACLGFAVGEAPPVVLHSHSEAALITTFLQHIGEAARLPHAGPSDAKRRVRVIAHNAAFDVGMLFKRATILQVERPAWFPWRFRPWEFDKVFCTMRAWDSIEFTSLDNLCFYLGVPSPKTNGITGADVTRLIREGRIQEVADYCAGDIEAMRECAYLLALDGDGF